MQQHVRADDDPQDHHDRDGDRGRGVITAVGPDLLAARRARPRTRRGGRDVPAARLRACRAGWLTVAVRLAQAGRTRRTRRAAARAGPLALARTLALVAARAIALLAGVLAPIMTPVLAPILTSGLRREEIPQRGVHARGLLPLPEAGLIPVRVSPGTGLIGARIVPGTVVTGTTLPQVVKHLVVQPLGV